MEVWHKVGLFLICTILVIYMIGVILVWFGIDITRELGMKKLW